MKFFKSYYKKSLYKLAVNPFSYIIGLIIIFFSSGYFFVVQNFFSTTGSTDLRVFFSAFPYISILAVPALTALAGMTGNDLSLPGKVYELPLARLLSLLTFILCILVLTIFVPVAANIFGDIQIAQIVCGYLGIIFYYCATVCLSVFLFSVLNSSPVAFVTTALILAVFNSSHLIPLFFNVPAFVASFFKSISFAWHFDAAGKGIIDLRDIIFYIAITFFFFALACIFTEKKRGNTSASYRKYSVFSVMTFILLLANGAVVNCRIDITPSRLFSVTEYSKTLLKEVEEPLSITYYRSESLASLYPSIRDVRDFLEAYCSQSKNVNLSVIDPAKENSESGLNNYGIYGQLVDYGGRGDSASVAYSAIVISYLDRIESIPFVLNTSTLEFDLTGRIQSMVRGTQRLVQVVTGNGLDLDEDYSYVQPWLESMGFSVIHTYLPSEVIDDYYGAMISFEQLPAVPVLVLGTSYFNQVDTFALENFVQNGGKAFVYTTPYIVNFANDWSVTSNPDNVIYMLEKYGLFFKESLTADVSNFRIEFYSDSTSTGAAATPKTEYVNYSLWPVLMPQTNALNGMTTFWPCAIDFYDDIAQDANVTLESLLITSSLSWQIDKINGEFYTNPFYVPQTPEAGDLKGPFTICSSIKLNNGNNGEFIVFGDQYQLTKVMFAYAAGSTGDMRNLDFVSDVLLEMQGQGAVLPLKNRSYINTTLYKVDSANLNSYRIKIFSLVWLVPFVILCVIYGIVWYRRRLFNSERK